MNVLTSRFGNTRTGANLSETTLNTSNVNVHQFGKLFTRDVDGDVYTQPLVAQVQVPRRGLQMVVYVATANNSVYAYDAEDPAIAAPYWHRGPGELGAPVPRTEVGGAGYQDFQKTIGITSTPVIDLAANTIYIEVKSKQGGQYFHHLHARDLRTGDPRPNSPVQIQGDVQGAGDGQVNGRLHFDARIQLNRPGLLLLEGVIYLGFASHGDNGPYHGWVFAYDAGTLALRGVFCTTPDSKWGGVWQSGAGLAGNNGAIYCVAANGDLHRPPGGRDLANCLVELQLNAPNDLRMAAWYAPGNAEDLSLKDLDLSTGPVLVPGTSWVLVGSKEGYCYVVDPAQLDANKLAKLVQAFKSSLVMVLPPPGPERNLPESNIHGTPAFWNSPGNGLIMYVWGENDYLRAWRRDAAGFVYLAHSPMHAPPGMPGGMLTLSANQSTAGTGILWASHPYTEDANRRSVDGILRAFDAEDISQELWNSKQEAHRDDVGRFAKFCPPTVANGKVYLATFANPATSQPNHLVVYGALPGVPPPPPSPWKQADVGTPVVGSVGIGSGRFVVRGAGDDIEGAADSFHFVYQKAAGDCAIQARVRSIGNTDQWAKAGVMIRQSLMPESPQAMMVITPSHGTAFQRRPGVDQQLLHTPGQQVSAPFWLRMERMGDELIGSASGDGMTWQQIGSQNIALGPQNLIGLAVTAHNGSLLNPLPINESVFDNVTLTP